MLKRKYIFSLIVLFLEVALNFSQESEEITRNNFTREYTEKELEHLALLAWLYKFNVTVTEDCAPDRTCLLKLGAEHGVPGFLRKFMQSRISQISLGVHKQKQPQKLKPTSATNQNFTKNVTNNATEGLNTPYPHTPSPSSSVNYTKCGVYPSCFVQHLSEARYTFTCIQPLIIFAAAMGAILSLVIICSNLLIIIITLRTKSLRKPHGYFKLSLALADLIAGIFVLPSIVHNTLNRSDHSDNIYTEQNISSVTSYDDTNTGAAIFFGVMGILSTISALYSLLLLSMNSFMSVMWPLKYRQEEIMNDKIAFIGVVIVWIFSIAVASIPILANNFVVYGLSYYTFMYVPIILPNEGASKTSPAAQKYLHAILYTVFVWGVPFVVTWVLTILTSIQGHKMLKQSRELRRKSARSERILYKPDRELIRTVAFVLCLFTITILPIFGVTIALPTLPQDICLSNAVVVAFFAATYVFICGRFLNVIAYNVLQKEFQVAGKKFAVDVVELIRCHKAAEAGLPQRISTPKNKPKRFWVSNGPQESMERKQKNEINTLTRTKTEPSTNGMSSKRPLSPKTLSMKLSTSNVIEDSGSSLPGHTAGNNSISASVEHTK